MRIRVETHNGIAVDGISGEWDEHEIDTIPDITARSLAQKVRHDSVTRQDGTWLVSQVQCYRTPAELLSLYTKACCVSDSLWENYCAHPATGYFELWQEAKREESVLRDAYYAATGQEPDEALESTRL